MCKGVMRRRMNDSGTNELGFRIQDSISKDLKLICGFEPVRKSFLELDDAINMNFLNLIWSRFMNLFPYAR